MYKEVKYFENICNEFAKFMYFQILKIIVFKTRQYSSILYKSSFSLSSIIMISQHSSSLFQLQMLIHIKKGEILQNMSKYCEVYSIDVVKPVYVI